MNSGKLLGKVRVPLDLTGAEARACVFHNGWISVGKEVKGSSGAQFHVNVKAEPDPRFVFQFDGEPECSPQVFQIQGSIRQPVFTCKFSFRSNVDRNQLSRSVGLILSFCFLKCPVDLCLIPVFLWISTELNVQFIFGFPFNFPGKQTHV